MEGSRDSDTNGLLGVEESGPEILHRSENEGKVDRKTADKS